MQKSTTPGDSHLNWDDLRYFLEVARTQRASGAAKRLGVDYTTVARRVRALEDALGTLLFDKSRSGGFILTAEGQRLLAYVDAMETTVQTATEHVANTGHALSGHVRVGSTEGFGCFFLAPHLARFQDAHPNISIDLLPVPHFVSLSKREADIAVTLERPEHGQTVYTKLCDYRLRLFATQDYLDRHEPIRSVEDLKTHRFASYIDDLAFSYELLYLERAVPGAISHWRSTSAVAQYHAALQGCSLAILPCFMTAQDPRLIPVLADDIVVTRAFYLSCREDLRKLKRITAVWEFLRSVAEMNRPLLMGDDRVMLWSATPAP